MGSISNALRYSIALGKGDTPWTKLESHGECGTNEPLGYVVLQHGVRLDRPVQAYDKWINRIPGDYRTSVLQEEDEHVLIAQDPYELALLKHYRSVIPMAQEARKPMFHLKPADGAIGPHLQSAHDAYNDFRALAAAIVEKASLGKSIDHLQPELPLW
jgi:chromosome partitioning protein